MIIGPTLTNAFLCLREQIRLNKCPDEFKTAYYRRYVDDIFVLLRSPDHCENIKDYLASKHRNIVKTSKATWLLNIETLDSPVRKSRIIPCLF